MTNLYPFDLVPALSFRLNSPPPSPILTPRYIYTESFSPISGLVSLGQASQVIFFSFCKIDLLLLRKELFLFTPATFRFSAWNRGGKNCGIRNEASPMLWVVLFPCVHQQSLAWCTWDSEWLFTTTVPHSQLPIIWHWDRSTAFQHWQRIISVQFAWMSKNMCIRKMKVALSSMANLFFYAELFPTETFLGKFLEWKFPFSLHMNTTCS